MLKLEFVRGDLGNWLRDLTHCGVQVEMVYIFNNDSELDVPNLYPSATYKDWSTDTYTPTPFYPTLGSYAQLHGSEKSPTSAKICVLEQEKRANNTNAFDSGPQKILQNLWQNMDHGHKSEGPFRGHNAIPCFTPSPHLLLKLFFCFFQNNRDQATQALPDNLMTSDVLGKNLGKREANHFA